MSTTRMFQRRQWRSDCPALFNRDNVSRRAEARGLKIEALERGRAMSFQAWRRKNPGGAS